MDDSASPNTERASRDKGLWGWLWQPRLGQELKIQLRARARSDTPDRRERARSLAESAELLLQAERRRIEPGMPLVRFLNKRSISESLLAEGRSSLEAEKNLAESLHKAFGPFDSLIDLGNDLAAQSLDAEWGKDGPDDGYRRLALTLARRADPLHQEVENLWASRLWRLIAPLAVLVIVALTAGPALDYLRLRQETKYPWHASSTYAAEPGCVSPSQVCDNEEFFFCTEREDDPWIQFDLGASRRVSLVRVKNRTECDGCMGRAVPLVVELSEDGAEWTTVAQTSARFRTWTFEFPAHSARFVRLLVRKNTYFHLKHVQIVAE